MMVKYEGMVSYKLKDGNITYKSLQTCSNISSMYKEIRIWHSCTSPDEQKTFKWVINAYSGSKITKTYQGTRAELSENNKIDTRKTDAMSQTIMKKDYDVHNITIETAYDIRPEYMPKFMTNINNALTREIKRSKISLPDSMMLKLDHEIRQTPHKRDTISCLVYDAKTGEEIAYIDIPHFVKIGDDESIEIKKLKKELFKFRKHARQHMKEFES